MGLIMDQHLPFAFETVFSYLKPQTDGTYKSKADTIVALQKAGCVAVLVFVGLASCRTLHLAGKDSAPSRGP